MKYMRNLLLLTILVISSLSCSASAENGDFTVIDSYWGTDQRVEVAPGETATLTIILRTEFHGTVKNIEANLTLPSNFQSIGGSQKVTATYSTGLAQGSLLKLLFPMYITPEAHIGNYSAELEIRYYQENIVWKEPPRVRVKIFFNITGRPEIKLQTSNFELREGKQITSLELKNIGEAKAYNLKISEISSSNVIIGDYFYEGSIEAGKNQSIDLNLMVPPGTEGKAVTALVKGSYYGPLNAAYQFSQSIQFIIKQVEAKPIISIYLSSSELSIGKSENLTIFLKNTGLHDVSGVRVSLTADSILKLFTVSENYIENIESKKETTLPVQIYVPSTTQAATSTLTVSITYFDEVTRLTDYYDQKFNLLLRGFIDISLTDVTVIPSSPRMGSSFSITMTVTNIGTSAASAAYAIPSLENLPLSSFGAKSSYIGNVEINSPITFTLNLQANNSTMKDIVLPVTLKYMDNLRTIHEEYFNVSFQLLPPLKTDTSNRNTSGNSNNLLIYSIIGIIGLAIIGIILWRRR